MEIEEVEPGPETLEHQILHRIGCLGHFMQVHAGGRSGKQHILVKLYCHEGHLSQQELLDSSGVTSASLSEVLAKLEAEGLIERRRLAHDGRQREVFLTEVGIGKARAIKGEKERFEKAAFDVLDDEEKHQLLGMLDRVNAHWDDFEHRRVAAERPARQQHRAAAKNSKDTRERGR